MKKKHRVPGSVTPEFRGRADASLSPGTMMNEPMRSGRPSESRGGRAGRAGRGSPMTRCAPLLAVFLGLGFSAGLGLTGCKKKKTDSASQPAPSAPPAPPVDAPEPPSASDGVGTAPPFVGTQDFQPFEDLTPQTGNALNQQMNDIGQLIYGYDLPFDPYVVESFIPSPAELAAERCMNEYLSQITFQQADAGSGQPPAATEGGAPPANVSYRAVVPDKKVFDECMGKQSVVAGSGIRTDTKVNILLSCQGTGQTGPSLSNVPVTAPEWNKGFCEVGNRSEVRYNIMLEVKQTGGAAGNPAQSPEQTAQTPVQSTGDGVLRSYKRTKALTSTSAGSCSWEWRPTERVKSFNDCVYLDRIDIQGNATARFAYVEFDRVIGQQSLAGGFQFTGGRAKVRLNNFSGDIAFQANAAPTWSLTKSGAPNPVTGQLLVPQGHGIPPTVFPGGGAVYQPGNPSGPGQVPPGQPGVYVPVTGPGGQQELRCGPQVTAQNITLLGNGVVTQNSAQVGSSTFYTGYFHENQTDARTSFLARIENNQLLWCRTYVVQNQGSSEGVFVTQIGGQYYAAFVTRQNVYVPIGNPVFQNVRSPQEIPSIYLAKFDPMTGNPTNATWFNPFSSEAASLNTVILDGQQLPQGFVRLRAFVTQATPPGCQNPGTGDYGIVLKSDLSALATQQAEFCPSAPSN